MVHQANVRCHFSFYAMFTEAKSCQFLFYHLSLPVGDKLENKTDMIRGTKYYPLTPAAFGMIPEGMIICPQRANPTQSYPQLLGKDKLQWYSPTEGWRAKEAYWSAAPEGTFHNSFWSCSKLIREAVSLCGHCWANITQWSAQRLLPNSHWCLLWVKLIKKYGGMPCL